MGKTPKRPRDPNQLTDGDYYGMFMTGLLGLLDDAELSGYSLEGIAHLKAAREAFGREFHERHPAQWGQPRNST